MEEEYYTVREFAYKMGVKRQTVYGWISRGLLEVVEEKAGPFAHILIPKKAADKFTMPKGGRPRKTIDTV